MSNSVISPFSRRTILGSIITFPLIPSLAKASTNISEFQQGDPTMEPEEIIYSGERVSELNSLERRASFQNRISDFGSLLVQEAKNYVGINRADNKDEIREMCNLFGLGFSWKKNGKDIPTAYCAIGVSFVSALVYAKQYNSSLDRNRFTKIETVVPEVGQYHFYPTPSVINMYHGALSNRRWRNRTSTKNPKPGWLVVFDWKQKNTCFSGDHVGIIESFESSENKLRTIEFNTTPEGAVGSQRDGGYVARRIRDVSGTVKGYIDTSAQNPFSRIR